MPAPQPTPRPKPAIPAHVPHGPAIGTPPATKPAEPPPASPVPPVPPAPPVVTTTTPGTLDDIAAQLATHVDAAVAARTADAARTAVAASFRAADDAVRAIADKNWDALAHAVKDHAQTIGVEITPADGETLADRFRAAFVPVPM